MLKYGQIYKITNDVNGKFYIGQTIHGIKSRMERHIVDAVGNRNLQTHLARAIRKYGPEHFHIEEIDTADNQEDLTSKEYNWIRLTNAIHKGYNETSAEFKCGGNTYMSKTDDEIKIIKDKISQSNGRGNNGNARPIKMFNVITKQELYFDSIKSAQLYFKEEHHTTFSRRCKHTIKKLYLNEWKIAYKEFEYDDTEIYIKKKSIHVGGRKISVYDNIEDKTTIYSSYREFERKNGLKYKSVAVKNTYVKGDVFIFNNRYVITLLN